MGIDAKHYNFRPFVQDKSFPKLRIKSKNKTFCKIHILHKQPKVSKKWKKYSEKGHTLLMLGYTGPQMKFQIPRDKELGTK